MTSRDIDLSLAIRELSNAHEELSLLCRMSEVFSFLSIDEICVGITKEAVNTIGVQTAAVLFLNDNSDMLYTKTCQGKWYCERVIDKTVDVIWRQLVPEKHRHIAGS
ncbi:MAG TPA: hypothetical protein VLD55_08095 [Candidatus Sulfobium mesophilum]|nr:hypothetical protein [Candidatus Sulfobium mesophilum]